MAARIAPEAVEQVAKIRAAKTRYVEELTRQIALTENAFTAAVALIEGLPPEQQPAVIAAWAKSLKPLMAEWNKSLFLTH